MIALDAAALVDVVLDQPAKARPTSLRGSLCAGQPELTHANGRLLFGPRLYIHIIWI